MRYTVLAREYMVSKELHVLLAHNSSSATPISETDDRQVETIKVDRPMVTCFLGICYLDQ
jgi:hypothetical protein